MLGSVRLFNFIKTVETFTPPAWGMAGPTRLELATSCVTGMRSNQLNYDPAPCMVSLGGRGLEPLTPGV